MQREITPDLIKNIFCLYYGQKVLRITDDEIGDHRLVTMTSPFLHLYHNSKNKGTYKLELTALSDITDEDAIEAVYLNWGYMRGEPVDVEWARRVMGTISMNTVVSDYLRSKGYALPAHGFTVQELIDAGVYRIKTKEQ